MENRLAVIAIILDDPESTDRVNTLLHENKDHIVGRMGIPYRERNLNVITVVIDAPEAQTSALSGKLGMIDGVSVKTVYSKEK